MKCAGGAFEQSYNAQAAVDTDSFLIVATHVTQAGNDKQQVEPMLAHLQALPERLGRVDTLVADAGYCSENNILLCEQVGIEPTISVGRDEHHPGVMTRFTEPDALAIDATVLQKMKHKLKTKTGRVIYAVRKCTVEPVFGIIKSVMGFRHNRCAVWRRPKGNGIWCAWRGI